MFYTKKRRLSAFDDKRIVLVDGLHPLAYGQHAIPMRVEHDASAGGVGVGTRVLTTAETRNRRIALSSQKYSPAGEDQNECCPEGRRACDSTLQDGDLVANNPPAANSLPSTAPARLDAAPPEALDDYMWDDGV